MFCPAPLTFIGRHKQGPPSRRERRAAVAGTPSSRKLGLPLIETPHFCSAARRPPPWGEQLPGAMLCLRLLAHETWEIHEAVFRVWALVRPSLAGKDARPILKC
jgi:hypothetical protein